MRKRGRKSSSEIEISQGVKPATDMVHRPDAPYDLNDEESQVWWTTVNGLPADWFPTETHPVLSQYCKHVVASKRVSQLIDDYLKPKKGVPFDSREYDRLLKMQEREGRAISSLATRMRLTQHSRMQHNSAAVRDLAEQSFEEQHWPFHHPEANHR